MVYVTSFIGENIFYLFLVFSDLSSDHSLIQLTMSNILLSKTKPDQLTNKSTDWETFRTIVDAGINLRTRLKTEDELEKAAAALEQLFTSSAKAATRSITKKTGNTRCYPREVVDLIRRRRKARKLWQQTRDPEHKNRFNALCKRTKRLIREVNNKTFEDFIHSVDNTKETNYSLWRVASVKKKPLKHIPPIRAPSGTWVLSDQEKADIFANHLGSHTTSHLK